MKPLHIFKIGGNIINSPKKTTRFLTEFAAVQGAKILVHGGGKLADDLAQKLNIPQEMHEGRRITSKETLDIAMMVYAGLINKKLVAELQHVQCNALGLCGADLNLISAVKRVHAQVNFGFVGDLNENSINIPALDHLLNMHVTPIFSALTYDKKGRLLNTNADTIASQLAISLSKDYDVSLYLCFEKKGVLYDMKDENSFLESINFDEYQALKENKKIHNGMLPKLDAAFRASNAGASSVFICQGENFKSGGTQILPNNSLAL